MPASTINPTEHYSATELSEHPLRVRKLLKEAIKELDTRGTFGPLASNWIQNAISGVDVRLAYHVKKGPGDRSYMTFSLDPRQLDTDAKRDAVVKLTELLRDVQGLAQKEDFPEYPEFQFHLLYEPYMPGTVYVRSRGTWQVSHDLTPSGGPKTATAALLPREALTTAREIFENYRR